MNDRLQLWKDLNNLVFVEIHQNNELTVEFPPNSKENTKVKLVNNGSTLYKTNWDYLRKLSKLNYIIVVQNVGSLFTKPDNWKDKIINNSLQTFELALYYIEDINKLLLVNLMNSISSGIALQYNSAGEEAEEFNNRTWIHRKSRQIRTIYDCEDISGYDFNLILMQSFFLLHKSILGFKNLNNSEILELIHSEDWYKSKKIRTDTVLDLYVWHGGTPFLQMNISPYTVTDMDILNSYSHTSRRLQDRIVKLKLQGHKKIKKNSGEDVDKIKKQLITKIVNETNYGIIPYSVQDHKVMNGMSTAWYINDDKYLGHTANMVREVYQSLIS